MQGRINDVVIFGKDEIHRQILDAVDLSVSDRRIRHRFADGYDGIHQFGMIHAQQQGHEAAVGTAADHGLPDIVLLLIRLDQFHQGSGIE